MAKQLKLDHELVKACGMFYSKIIQGYNDGYFLSIEDYEIYLADNNIELNDKNKILWLCDELEFNINVDRALADALEDHHEDADDQLEDVGELKDFVKKWCEKQNIKSYFKSRDYFISIQPPKKTTKTKVEEKEAEPEQEERGLFDVIFKYSRSLNNKKNWA
jgi:hypothetical protein